MNARLCAPESGPGALLVLDTNVVLDWLVFRNKAVAPIGEAVLGGALLWAATDAMQDELEHVLDRCLFDRWGPDRQRIRAAWASSVQVITHVEVTEAPRLRCQDPDDQKFIDLARQIRADALLSRDRALLTLAPRAGRSGLRILTPEAWIHLQHRAAG